MIQLGKRDVEHGESYEKRILQWHKDARAEQQSRDGSKTGKKDEPKPDGPTSEGDSKG
jgi:hypothetical protein